MNALLNEDALEARIREIARAEAARPALCSQRTAPNVVGIDGREFLRLARAGAFPSTKERRTIVARTSDVLAYFESRLATQAGPTSPEFGHSRSGLRRVSP